MKIILTRKQVTELYNIFQDNAEVLDQIELIVTNDSGIGPTIKVKYSAEVNITDVENW